MPDTPLDLAAGARDADPSDPALRLGFYERILDSELILLLATEPAGERVEPRVFDLAEGRFVLAFDRDDRLAAFLDAPAPYAALSGRRLAALLAGQGIGLGLNLGAPSASLIPAAAVDWLAGMAGQGPVEAAARPASYARPEPPAALLAALGPKLAAMAELISSAHLVEARYPEAGARLLLALAGVPEPARPAVAEAVAEAVRFTGLDALVLDVTFLDAGTAADLERAGLRLALPTPAARPPRPGPGMDPDRPPRL